ncbi:vegetative cell wall protein gp1-like [Lathyrus oleraceus]|uniref:vegetative cell wall protein gp1-like n=1 Tax=Pisum sativum TaxID=3888 RepID=UPI0021D0117A|nr:vegetative cell wall protein gp1-like [Pisum sativum]
MFNEPISPPSSTPPSPPYHTISSHSELADPQYPTLAHLQARALSTHQQSEPEANIPPPSEQPTTPPSETPIETLSENPIIPNSQPPIETTHTPPASPSLTPEPEPTFLTLEEAITLFAESSMEKIRSLSKNSGINDNPSRVSIH